MQKHTPGPWIIGQESTDLMNPDVVCDGGRFHAIDGPGHGALAVVVTQMGGDFVASTSERLMANARLIAASPELLSMLIAIYESEFMYGSWPERSNIREVIRKAGGQVTS